MSRRSIPKETRDAVVEAMRAVDADSKAVAQQYGVSLATVYNWTRVKTETVVPLEK